MPAAIPLIVTVVASTVIQDLVVLAIISAVTSFAVSNDLPKKPR